MAAVRDIIILAIVVTMVGIGFFASYKTINDMYDKLLGIEAFNQSAEAVEAAQAGKALTNRMDYVVFGIFVAMVLAILISGWFIAGNAMFSIIYFFVVVIGVVVSTVLANAWETMTQHAIFGSTLTHFPITNNLILNLPTYLAIVGFLGMIVVFAKPAMAGGGGQDFI